MAVTGTGGRAAEPPARSATVFPDPVRRLPADLARRAGRLLGGGIAVVRPRAAASVLLIRDRPGSAAAVGSREGRPAAGAAGPAADGASPTGWGAPPAADGADPTSDRLQVYLQRRVPAMAFAPGMTVFPGGRVDPADVGPAGGARAAAGTGEVEPGPARGDIADVRPALAAAGPGSAARPGWRGPDARRWAAVLGCEPALAAALVCAAVRETFEETGVLLGVRPAGPAGPAGGELEAGRQQLVAHRTGLAALLARWGRAVPADRLVPWAHWVTPRFEPRRYDTWFFLAALPAGAIARDVSGEADRAGWYGVRAALDAAGAGRVAMLPPTYDALARLVPFGSATAALAAARAAAFGAPGDGGSPAPGPAGPGGMAPLMPGVVAGEDGVPALLLPGDAGFVSDYDLVDRGAIG